MNLIRWKELDSLDKLMNNFFGQDYNLNTIKCPTCHSGLEMHQIRAEKRFDAKTSVKILYFTQLLGLALGLKPRKVGIHENISDSIGLLKEKGLA